MPLLHFFQKISKTAYLVAFIALLTRIGYFMSLPFLAIYLTREGIFTPSEIGIVIGISGLVFSVTGLCNGLYADRHSQRKIIIVAFILSGFCYFGFALSIKFFFALVCINAALGWFRSLADISAISLMAANTENENLSYAYSMRFIAVNLGLILGPLIGASLANQDSLLIFYIAGIIHILVGVFLIFFGREQLEQSSKGHAVNLYENFCALCKDKILINITFINFVMWTAYSQLDSTIPQYVAHLVPNPSVLVCKLMIINAANCIIFQPFVLRWAEKHSLKMSGVLGSLLFSMTFVLIGNFPSPTTLMIASWMLSIGELFILPVNGLLLMRTAPKHLIASYNGLSSLGILGMSVGPILGGYGLQYLGSTQLFLLIALLPLIALWRYMACIPH